MKATTLTLLLFAVSLPALGEKSQKERCAPNESKTEMMCVNRNGHCVDVTIDGQKTVALADEETGRRVHSIKHGEDVCWMLANPVSTKLRVSAKTGGIFPSFVGNIEQINVNVYPLTGAKSEGRLDSLDGVALEADGNPNGTWRLTSEKPLKKGEYILVFRVFGKNNWDRQAVLVNLDPALKPGPADTAGATK
ncbi:MAG: hypothetical protein IT186_26050 [Acidobacteria bacterium]|nr:hypothetical protein [Acidobacteriota bacterium]MCK6682007.1 hypothetical protein [Thermoanaerobaculia bacterium]